MELSPRLAREEQRIAALRAFAILDTPPEPAFDDLAALAAHICGAPIALVSFVDQDRQWFKAAIGLPFPETSRDVSFCAHAILQPNLFVVPDTQVDNRFVENPMVNGALSVRFYAGAPLVTPDGATLGTLCVMDREPRSLSPAQEEGLRILAREVMAQLLLRQRNREVIESEKQLLEVFRSCPVAFIIHRVKDGTAVDANTAFTDLLGWSREEILGRTSEGIGLLDAEPAERLRKQLASKGWIRGAEVSVHARDGSARCVLMSTELAELRGEPHALTTFMDVTSRQEAASLAARLAAIVESSEDAIVGKNLESIITTWNTGAEKIFGYSAGEMVGTSIVRLIPPERQFEEEQILGQIRRGEAVRNLETSRITKDGRRIEVSVTASPIRDTRGTVVGASKVARDITSRKAADAALRASEDRYRTLFDYAPDGILIADSKSRYIDANPAICQMLGYTREELCGLERSDIVAPDEVPPVQGVLDELNSSVDPRREVQLRRKDGSLFPAEVIATRMPDGNILVMLRDVTERNRASDEIRTAEERMRFALQNADVGIWEIDFATGALRCSETLQAHYGYEPGTFPGTVEALLERVHPEDREAALERARLAMISGADFVTEHRSVRPDKTVRTLAGAGRVHLGKNGEPVRAIGISMDVTARRLLETQYQHAQKMEAVGRLAGGVAHDFNNLLTAILGYCELLLGSLNPGDPRREDVEEIHKAGSSAAALTRQLLAFSRKQIIEPALLDLNVVLASMLGMLGRLIGEDIEVVVRYAAGRAEVLADRGQLEQILLNLALNARDAMSDGGTLTIEIADVELDEQFGTGHFAVNPGPYIALTVTDTGVGMSAEVQTHLFEPFFTTKDQSKGTGLGLATVHGIVTRSGGGISVYSEVDKGTVFKVYLPRAAAMEASATEPLPAAARPGLTVTTVLLVEDAQGVRELTQRILRKQGFKVFAAANGVEALRIVEQNPALDILLTDVVMPGTSGPELAKLILTLRPAMKVVYMSGYTEEAIIHRGVLNPDIAFVNKPFTSDTLARKLREVIDK